MEPLLDNFVKATGWSILHSLWQGALIYGILLIIIASLPKLTSRLKHNLAYLAQCLLFISFCATFYSLFSLPEKSIGLPAPSLNIGQYTIIYLSELPSGWSSFAESLFPYIVALYAIGLSIQLIILFSGYQKIQRLKHGGRDLVPADWAVAFAKVKSALKIRREVGFYLSSSVNVPLVIGYFKPVVLFPVALATQMDIRQVEAILIHELSHIRRNDYLLNLIITVMQTTLFFNPFIWLTGKFIDEERENACDDLVLKHTGTPLTYAHALLKLELFKSTGQSALSVAAIGKTQHLYQRIKRITDMKTNYMNAKQRLLAMTLILATLISLAWVSPLKYEPAVEDVKAKLNQFIEVPVFKPVQEISEMARRRASTASLDQDTTKKKTKIRIVTTDEKGDTKIYNSFQELPDSVKSQMKLNYIAKSGSYSFQADSGFGSPAMKDTITIFKRLVPSRMLRSFDSSDPYKIADEARNQANDVRKYYNSPEWKKHIEEITKNSKAAGKIAADISVRVNSADFQSHLNDVLIKGEKIREKFNSEEWKKQMEELKEFQSSKEYKELREKQRKELDKLKKKKGIKTPLGEATIAYDFSEHGIPNFRYKEVIVAPPTPPAAPPAPAASPAQ